MLGAMLLSRPKPPQAGAKGQPLQGYSSQRQLPPKVSGPPLAAASTPGRRAESTASACEITHSKFKRAIIGAYFVARFIAGSDEFDEDKYRMTRERELKMIGSVAWENLKEAIDDASVIQRIQAAFDRSKRDWVFQV